MLRSIPGTVDVSIQDSPSQPELEVQVDHDAAAQFGLVAGAVAMQVRLAGQGEIAGTIRPRATQTRSLLDGHRLLVLHGNNPFVIVDLDTGGTQTSTQNSYDPASLLGGRRLG